MCQEERQGECQQVRSHSLYNLAWEVTLHHVCSILFIRREHEDVSTGRGLQAGEGTRDPWGPRQMSPCPEYRLSCFLFSIALRPARVQALLILRPNSYS